MDDKEFLDYVEEEVFHKMLAGVAVLDHLGYTKFEAGSWAVTLRADEVSRLLDMAKGKNT